jgi:hypothetical protein
MLVKTEFASELLQKMLKSIFSRQTLRTSQRPLSFDNIYLRSLRNGRWAAGAAGLLQLLQPHSLKTDR